MIEQFESLVQGNLKVILIGLGILFLLVLAALVGIFGYKVI